MAKIYTKVGDKGQTALLDGGKVLKSDKRIWATGAIDELNAAIGFVRSGIPPKTLKGLEQLDRSLEQIQHWLFDLGGSLATKDLLEHHVLFLENEIDEMTGVLPALKQFVLPGGHELASRLHLARTICRRAERYMVALLDEPQTVDALPFINRLSDYLFTCARFSNHLFSTQDVVWKKLV